MTMLTNLTKRLKTGTALQSIGLIAIILGISISMQISNGNFLSSANLEVMAMNLIFEGIMAIGMTFVIIGGGIDLSVSGVFPFAEIIVAKLMVQAGLPVVPAIMITLTLCLGIGLLNATLINLLRVHPMVITMGMMLTLRGINLAITNGRSIAGFSDEFIFLGQGKLLGINLPIVFFIVAAIILGYLLKNHPYFRQLYFIGGGERAARLSGVKVGQVKSVVYMLSALLAGIAGVMAAAQYGAAHWSHGNLSELKAIAAVAIGGADVNGGSGNVFGTVLGISFLAVVHNAFVSSGINTFWYDAVNGLMLLIAILFSKYIERKNVAAVLRVKQMKLDEASGKGGSPPAGMAEARS
ncbi:MAG: ABC transporter permease [Propionivibrio sp.]